MIQCALAVAYPPIGVTFVDFADHIYRSHGEHHLPQHRNEQRSQVQRIEPRTFESLQPLMALDGSLVAGGYRQDSCIVKHLADLQGT
ncbi:hypothetical protein D3C81_1190570 [compost metagenome]